MITAWFARRVVRLAMAGAIGLGGLGGVAASPALAASLLANGDFTGAQYATGPLAGATVATPFNFTSHTYLQNFAWTDSGCDCLDWVAQNGSQVIAHAPADPAGYHGNVYVADASPSYDRGTYLMQTLGGLTAGKAYRVTFLQAAGDYYTQADYAKPFADTAQWVVGLGGNVSYQQQGKDYTWVLSSDAVLKSSSLMHIGGADGTAPWQAQSLTFTATAPSELLTFFASGSGAPPFALLADVGVSAVPEPSSWIMAIFGLGFIGVVLRRRASPAIPARA